MKFVTHNEKEINFDGCRQGSIKTTYDELYKVFGRPRESDGYKVDAQWDIEFEDGTIAYIYNYKNGKNYNGDEGMDVVDITDWHIGGESEKSVERIKEIIEGKVIVK